MLLIVALIGISLLPVISVGIDSHDTESERFIYPASVFACIFVVQLLHALLKGVQGRIVGLVLLVSFHLFFLYQASLSYRYASYVSRFTIESLNLVPGVSKLTFSGLPAQYKGALLFRIGFPVWAPGMLHTTYEKATVQSFQEVTEPILFKRVISPTLSEPGHLHIDFTGNIVRLY
jgi:phosphoglycerol transferase MdoB-like AlkP superfamily enzyme